MKQAQYFNSSASDRFSGEVPDAPLWEYCSNCANKIVEGEQYYEHFDDKICTVCAKRYAFNLFLKDAKFKRAERDM